MISSHCSGEELRKNTNVSESAAEIEPNGRTTLLLEDFQ